MLNLGVAFFTILIAPVGIVVIAANSIIGFLNRRTLLSAACWRTIYRKCKAVFIAQFLFYSKEISPCIVESAIYIPFLTPATRTAYRESPSVFLHPGTVGKH